MTKPVFFSKQVDQSAYYYLNLTDHCDKPLSIICGGWEHCLPDYRVRRATFPYRGVEFVARGRGVLKMGGRVAELMPGMAFSYRPGVPHEIRNDPSEPMLKYFIDFAGTEADALIDGTALKNSPIQVSEPNRVKGLFDEIQATAEDPTSINSRICVLQLRILLLRIDSLAVQSPFTHSRAMHSFVRCKRCIDESYASLSSLADAAKACRMDAATICRLFKRFHNRTPYQYLLELKMRHAAERLQNSGLLVKEIADDMGFTDPFHFSRSFKRVHGVSPQRFVELTSRSS